MYIKGIAMATLKNGVVATDATTNIIKVPIVIQGKITTLSAEDTVASEDMQNLLAKMDTSIAQSQAVHEKVSPNNAATSAYITSKLGNYKNYSSVLNSNSTLNGINGALANGSFESPLNSLKSGVAGNVIKAADKSKRWGVNQDSFSGIDLRPAYLHAIIFPQNQAPPAPFDSWIPVETVSVNHTSGNSLDLDIQRIKDIRIPTSVNMGEITLTVLDDIQRVCYHYFRDWYVKTHSSSSFLEDNIKTMGVAYLNLGRGVVDLEEYDVVIDSISAYSCSNVNSIVSFDVTLSIWDFKGNKKI